MARRELHLISILLVIAIILVLFTPFFRAPLVEEDASNFVLEDLNDKYPGADIEIMEVTEMTNDAGEKYFELKAKVTKKPNGSCPERSHIFYNYPEQNFVPQPEEIITRNCKVCTEGICTIAFEEEAVIASHTFSQAVGNFLKTHPNASHTVKENQESWTVLWDDNGSGYEVELHRNGTILNLTSLD